MTYNKPDCLGIEPLYNCIYNLAIGYISGVIFYVLQSYYPDMKRERESTEIIHNDVIKIYDKMNFMIAFCRKYLTLDNGVPKILEIDGDYVYCRSIKHLKNGDNESMTRRFYVKEEFKRYSKDLTELINILKSRPVVHLCDERILFELTKIEQSKFPRNLQSVVDFWGTDVQNPELEQQLSQFEILKNDIEEILGLKYEYTFESLSQDEKEKYEPYLRLGKLTGAMLSSIIQKNNKD